MRPGIRLPVTIRKQPRRILRGQHMQRESLLRQLVQAEQDVAESKAFVAEQRRMIVESEREGYDCAKAIRRLEFCILIQQSREEDRAKILDELFEST